jgi:outer membrane protein assembly factor BamB
MKKEASMKLSHVFLFALATAFAVPAAASNWANWRGPNYNGSTDATNLPATFSPNKNVVWVRNMPGPSAATPIIWGDKVFISSTGGGELLAMCLDRKTGRELWRKTVGAGFRRDNRSNYASPSPVTNGEVVVFFYGTGDLVTYDLDGKELWRKKIENGKFSFQWTFSSTPALLGGKIYLQVLQRNTRAGKGSGGDSYLLAMDAKTGKQLFRHLRPSKAKAESLEAFSTPIPYEANGRKELVVVGGDCLSGHNLDTGEEYWRWGTWNPGRIGHWRLVPSPVVGGGVVLASAPKKAPIHAVRAGLTGAHQGKNGLGWTGGDKITSDVPTPLFYKGSFYVLSDLKECLSKVDPRTGNAAWTTPLPDGRLWRASPTGADGKIWIMNYAGLVVIVDADNGKIVHQVKMTDKKFNSRDGTKHIRASIAVANNQLYIRTHEKLFCIGG